MTRFTSFLLFVIFAACSTAQSPTAAESGSTTESQNEPNSIADFTSGMERFEGYFNFYYDDNDGRIYLEVDKFNIEFLYVNSLPAGIGSNDIGLDRGQLGDTRVVKFVRSGPKIFLVQPNYGYRAESEDEAEKKSVEQAFAQSIIGGFYVLAQSDWTALVDITDFLQRDAHGIVRALASANQGNYRLDPDRSALYLPMTKNFPQNTEFEATVTFTGKDNHAWIRSVTPSPEAITVRMHHSFIELPDSQYQPREFDTRSGFGSITYLDYATPIDQPIVKKLTRRHRLNKKDPGAASSEAVEPIIYYVDRGAPEPIKSALVEGASWWNQAFEAAGYTNAFQVKIMPEDADPMDVRYNLIQWVHRSTRGWSYGSSVTDPRTGEIIKGHVTLGSLRVRQDFLIAEGLLAPYEEGKEVPDDMLEMALARLRQLSAHEVGHTLGISHNFSSSISDRASVMDYPHPLVKMDEGGNINLSEAYATGIGEWDKQVVKFGYSDFADGANEKEELEKIITESFTKGLVYITDQDARPPGGAHPTAHLWDNGTNAADELNRMMDIRRKIIDNFSEKNIRDGATMSSIEEAFVPMYLFHRYQIEGAAKILGGLSYSYAVKGDGQTVTAPVSRDDQMKALDALLRTITPGALRIPENVLDKIPPRAYGYPRSRETFNVRTGLTFDALGVAETAANISISFILHPQRASRLVEYNARDSAQPSLVEVIDNILESTWKANRLSGYDAEIQRLVDKLVMYHLIRLASSNGANEQARAIALLKLQELKELADRKANTRNLNEKAHFEYCSLQIQKFMEDPNKSEVNSPLSPPDGSPIGMDLEGFCGGDF